MREFPLQTASVASALIWPLAAGIAVVVWSKVRAAAHARRTVAVDGQVQDLYRSVEARPVPTELSMVVDALAEGEELAANAAAKAKAASPAGS